jgi:hypothetical protein
MRCALAVLACGLIATIARPAGAYTPDPIHHERERKLQS